MAVVLDSYMDMARWAVDNDVDSSVLKADVDIKIVNGCKNVYIVCDEMGYRGHGNTADEYYGLDYSDYDILRDLFGGYLNAMVIRSVPKLDDNGFYHYRAFGI